MLAAILLAAAAGATPAPAPPPLGLWPADVGAPAIEVDGVEFYVVEPEDDFFILAVQAITPALAKPEENGLRGLADIARRLGADAVLLLEELPVERIPEDQNTPLVGSGAFSAAAYLVFDCACNEQAPRVFRTTLPGRDGPSRFRVVWRRAAMSGALRPAVRGRTRRSRW